MQERGDFEQDPSVELSAFLSKITEWATVLGKEKNLVILTETEKIEKLRVKVDEEVMWRIFSNIIGNAVEYTPEKGTVVIHAQPHGEEEAEITVTDSGPGFSSKDLKYGTEQFYQGDRSRHKKEHAGLGLFIVNDLVLGCGGSLSLHNVSSEGGAKVRVILKRTILSCEQRENQI